MGGDRGVIASNRRYMRGAGSATCTADSIRHNNSHGANDPAVLEMETTHAVRHCAITDQP